MLGPIGRTLLRSSVLSDQRVEAKPYMWGKTDEHDKTGVRSRRRLSDGLSALPRCPLRGTSPTPGSLGDIAFQQGAI